MTVRHRTDPPTDAETDAADVENEQWLNQRRPKSVEDVLRRKTEAGEVATLPMPAPPRARERYDPARDDAFEFNDDPTYDPNAPPPSITIDDSGAMIELPIPSQEPPETDANT